MSAGRGKRRRGGRADAVEFWRAVELFGPQDVPKVSEKKCVHVVDEPVLPWQEGHRQRDKKPGPEQAWQHVVYCGIYSMGDAYADLRDSYPGEEVVVDEGPQPGDSAVAVFVVAASSRKHPRRPGITTGKHSEAHSLPSSRTHSRRPMRRT